MAVYYVDNAGNNGGAGTSPGAGAWQTCAKVNSVSFSPDDQIIFTAGQTFTGPLTITNSGTAGHYLCIGTGRLTGSTAGTGRTAQSSPAIITCPDGGNGINANDCEYVSFDNLSVTGSGVNTSTGATTSTGIGISLSSTQTTNKLNAVRVTACAVSGCKDGIAAAAETSKKGYADLQVWGCVVHACQRIGILMLNFTGGFGGGSPTQNSNVYVGYCHLYDLPGLAGGTGVGSCGEGVTIRNCTTGTVEYCVVHDINIVGDQGAGGTQGFGVMQSTGVTVQFNEAYNIYARQPSPIDGCGMDFETGANSCFAQYNYIHDCDGAGFLNGSVVSGLTSTSNQVRFNVFARNAGNNQAELYPFGSVDSSDTTNTTFYNNTIYASHGDVWNNIGGFSTHSQDALVNNVLMSAAGAFCINGTIATGELYGNLYYAIGGGGIKIKPNGTTYTSMATLRAASYEVTGGSSGVNADPLLNAPTTSTAGSLPGQAVTTVNGFDLGVPSPARDAGVDISGVVTLDHDFHHVPCSGHGANIGATIAPIPSARLGWR